MQEQQEVNLYDLLGVASTASAQEITAAFKERSLAFHPDKIAQSGLDPVVAAEKFAQIKVARDILLDPESRRRYDLELRAGAQVYGEVSDIDMRGAANLDRALVTTVKISISSALEAAQVDLHTLVELYKDAPHVLIELYKKNKIPFHKKSKHNTSYSNHVQENYLIFASAHQKVAVFLLQQINGITCLGRNLTTLTDSDIELALYVLTQHLDRLTPRQVFDICHYYHERHNRQYDLPNNPVEKLRVENPRIQALYAQGQVESDAQKAELIQRRAQTKITYTKEQLCDSAFCKREFQGKSNIYLFDYLSHKDRLDPELAFRILNNRALCRVLYSYSICSLAKMSIKHCLLILNDLDHYRLYNSHCLELCDFYKDEPIFTQNLALITKHTKHAAFFELLAINCKQASRINELLNTCVLGYEEDVLLCKKNPGLTRYLLSHERTKSSYLSESCLLKLIKCDPSTALSVIQDPFWLVMIQSSDELVTGLLEYGPEVATELLRNPAFEHHFTGKVLYEISERYQSLLRTILHNKTYFERLKNFRMLKMHTQQEKVPVANKVNLQEYYRTQRVDPAVQYYEFGCSYWARKEYSQAVQAWLYAIANKSAQAYLELSNYVAMPEYQAIIYRCAVDFFRAADEIEQFIVVGAQARVDLLAAQGTMSSNEALLAALQQDPMISQILVCLINNDQVKKDVRFCCAYTLAEIYRQFVLVDEALKYFQMAERIDPSQLTQEDYYDMAHYVFAPPIDPNDESAQERLRSSQDYFHRLSLALPYFSKAQNKEFIDGRVREHKRYIESQNKPYIDELIKQPQHVHLLDVDEYSKAVMLSSSYQQSMAVFTEFAQCCHQMCQRLLGLNADEKLNLKEIQGKIVSYRERAFKEITVGVYHQLVTIADLVLTLIAIDEQNVSLGNVLLSRMSSHFLTDKHKPYRSHEQDVFSKFVRDVGDQLPPIQQALIKINRVELASQLSLNVLQLACVSDSTARIKAQFAFETKDPSAAYECLLEDIGKKRSVLSYLELGQNLGRDEQCASYIKTRLLEKVIVDKELYRNMISSAIAAGVPGDKLFLMLKDFCHPGISGEFAPVANVYFFEILHQLYRPHEADNYLDRAITLDKSAVSAQTYYESATQALRFSHQPKTFVDQRLLNAVILGHTEAVNLLLGRLELRLQPSDQVLPTERPAYHERDSGFVRMLACMSEIHALSIIFSSALKRYNNQYDAKAQGFFDRAANNFKAWQQNVHDQAQGAGLLINQLAATLRGDVLQQAELMLQILSHEDFSNDRMGRKSIGRHFTDVILEDNRLTKQLTLCRWKERALIEQHDSLFNQYSYQILYKMKAEQLKQLEKGDPQKYRCFYRDYLLAVLRKSHTFMTEFLKIAKVSADQVTNFCAQMLEHERAQKSGAEEDTFLPFLQRLLYNSLKTVMNNGDIKAVCQMLNVVPETVAITSTVAGVGEMTLLEYALYLRNPSLTRVMVNFIPHNTALEKVLFCDLAQLTKCLLRYCRNYDASKPEQNAQNWQELIAPVIRELPKWLQLTMGDLSSFVSVEQVDHELDDAIIASRNSVQTRHKF